MSKEVLYETFKELAKVSNKLTHLKRDHDLHKITN